MYRIALCEDEVEFIASEESLCTLILDKMKIEYRLDVYHSGEELAQAHRAGEKYDVVLLDILMKGMSGIELARLIRKTDEQVTIIFITSSPDFALDGYDVRALHYLLKPVNQQVLESLLVKEYEVRHHKEYMLFDFRGSITKTALADILYLEIDTPKVAVNTQNGQMHYTGKLSTLLQEMPRGMFVRCHQSYAVNIHHVLQLMKTDIKLSNGQMVPISRTFRGEVQKAFMEMIRGE